MTQDREAGFTLIEALVALALGVSVVMVVLSTVRIAAVSARLAAQSQSDAEAFSRAGALLAGDAVHAVKLRVQGKDLFFTGQEREVVFAALPRPGDPPHDPVALRYTLRDADGGMDLLRATAPLLDSGKAGIFGPGVAVWHGAQRAEFRYLGAAGDWDRGWSDPAALPRAFGIAALNGSRPQLIAQFPDLIEADCAQGPSAACSVPAEAFQ
jgi:hypothetical protein